MLAERSLCAFQLNSSAERCDATARSTASGIVCGDAVALPGGTATVVITTFFAIL